MIHTEPMSNILKVCDLKDFRAQGNAVAMKGVVARDALFVKQPSGDP